MNTILIMLCLLHVWMFAMIIILIIAVKSLLKSDTDTSAEFVKVWTAMHSILKQSETQSKSDDCQSCKEEQNESR